MVNKGLFHGLFSARFFTFLCFFWLVPLQFEMAPRRGTNVLCVSPKGEKAGTCLMVNMYALGKARVIVLCQ